MAPTAAKPATTGTKKVKSGKPINSELKSSGVMRLSRGRMFHKRGLWHIAKWQKSQKPAERKTRTRVVKKEVKGEKNGKSRSVRVGKLVSVHSRFSLLLPLFFCCCFVQGLVKWALSISICVYVHSKSAKLVCVCV